MFWSFQTQAGRRLAAGTLGLVLLAAGCNRLRTGEAAPPKTVSDWFAVKVGSATVQLQLAIYPAEMEHGLMGRRDLGAGQGMLFVYAAPTPMSFWMHNTPLPLDIGFFGPDGELQEIYPLYPFDDTTVRSRSERLQFALEMNQGWYRANGIKPGARLDLAAIRQAILARGATPADFGLR